MGKFSGLPPRDEGEHTCIGLLVHEEAKRQLDLSDRLTPYTSQHTRPREMRLAAIEEGIWSWLRTGWCRVSEYGELVFWHPGERHWQLYTEDLNTEYLTYYGHHLQITTAYEQWQQARVDKRYN